MASRFTLLALVIEIIERKLSKLVYSPSKLKLLYALTLRRKLIDIYMKKIKARGMLDAEARKVILGEKV